MLRVQHSRFNVSKLILQQRLDGLCFDPETPDLELGVDAAVEVHPQGDGVNVAAVS